MAADDIAAAVAVIQSGQHLLLLRRAHNPLDPWSGHIALPGGRLESGESLLETARRETFEETGIILDDAHCIGSLPVSSAGRKCATSISLKGGAPNGPVQGSSNGFPAVSVMCGSRSVEGKASL